MTSDLLVTAFSPGEIFRVNYDLIRDYEIKVSADDFKISSAGMSVEEPEVSKLVWRKAFSGVDEKHNATSKFEAAEYKYFLRELLNFITIKAKLVFNRPDADAHCGKLLQIRIAKKYFKIPWTILSSGSTILETSKATVVKSLASAPLENGNVLYTSEVSNQTLSARHPWLLQELVTAQFDVTVVYVYGMLFCFRLSRDRFSGLDWRRHLFEVAGAWEKCELPDKHVFAVRDLMSEVGWSFGRLDFLQADNELIFLEINPNGQWAWLDPNRSNGLFAAMKCCMDPNSPMPLVRLK
jgi:hypothetical protein